MISPAYNSGVINGFKNIPSLLNTRLVLQTNNTVPTTTRKSIAFFRMKLDGFFEAINQCHFAAEISERTTLT